MSSLQTLLLASNRLTTVDDVVGVLAVPTLTCLDLQNNTIADPAVLEVLVQLPALGVLYLQGNPAVKSIPHYRKVVIARIPSLKYLDDRPVFEEERLRVEAWYRAFLTGGLPAAKDAEKAEVERQRVEKAERDERNFRGVCLCACDLCTVREISA